MAERVVLSTFAARPGKEAEIDAFLQQCRGGIAAAFEAHVNGPTANAVRQRTEELFTSQPDIVQATVLAAK